ncbi:hypothetical protein C8Q75DRAFT_719419 [Abortiporus biennis]|nr:hypothetical protein C8Q75DRAFT_719419 [Abortiporus biennis]
MTDITCSICLEPLKTPVSTPCGHLHCEDCLTELVASGPESVEAACPTCRAPFSIVQPDLRFVPQKYHKFMVPSIRRVYFDSTSQESRNLRTEIETLQERVRGLYRDKTLLMDRCEAAMAASSTHSLRERSARQENQRLERSNGELKKQFEEMRQKYEALKGKYRELKSA